MSLYNLRTSGDSYRITKFDNELNVESSYTVNETTCDCPAGRRPSCRHRQMLPALLASNLLDTRGYYDFNSGKIYFPIGETSSEDLE